jgi:hypothetical protein
MHQFGDMPRAAALLISFFVASCGGSPVSKLGATEDAGEAGELVTTGGSTSSGGATTGGTGATTGGTGSTTGGSGMAGAPGGMAGMPGGTTTGGTGAGGSPGGAAGAPGGMSSGGSSAGSPEAGQAGAGTGGAPSFPEPEDVGACDPDGPGPQVAGYEIAWTVPAGACAKWSNAYAQKETCGVDPSADTSWSHDPVTGCELERACGTVTVLANESARVVRLADGVPVTYAWLEPDGTCPLTCPGSCESVYDRCMQECDTVRCCYVEAAQCPAPVCL